MEQNQIKLNQRMLTNITLIPLKEEPMQFRQTPGELQKNTHFLKIFLKYIGSCFCYVQFKPTSHVKNLFLIK